MVACSVDTYFAIAWSINCLWRKLSRCSIHLYSLLIMERSKRIKTLIVLIAGLLVFYFIFKSTILLLVALSIALITITSDFLSEKIAWAWLKLANILGWINGKILLSIVYLFVLTPIALVYRILGKNNLKLKKENSSDTYYITRNHEYAREDLKNIW
jgi:hypothetical protein